MDLEKNTSKLSEDELIDFWNSYYYEKNYEKKEKNAIELPSDQNDLQKIAFDIEKQIKNNELSKAYNTSKYLMNKLTEALIEKNQITKVVINDGWGGFGLSEEAIEMFKKIKKEKKESYNFSYDSKIERNDEDLIKVVETLGGLANAVCASLKIVEIPKGIQYKINDYDGWEEIVY
jgi:hypothetical protein